MKIITKTISILAVTIILSITLTWTISRYILLKSFEKIEIDFATENILRVEQAFLAAIRTLDKTNLDWSSWDDTYQFIQDNNSDYESSNLTESTAARLEINIMSYIRPDTSFIYSKFYDKNTDTLFDTSAELKNSIIKQIKLIRNLDEKSSSKGILILPENRLFIFAARPILTSQDAGPAQGVLLFAKEFDEKAIKSLQDKLLTDLKFFILSAKKDWEGIKDVHKKFPVGNNIFIDNSEDEFIFTYIKLKDINNQEALIIKSTQDRKIYARGKATQRIIILNMISTALISLLVLFLLLNKAILSKLKILQKKIKEITQGTDLSQRVYFKGNDELSQLAESFDNMLDNIELINNELNKAVEIADKANQAKSDFLSNISHEIRTPLNSVMGFSEIIINSNNVEEIRRNAQTILQESEILLHLINSLLDHAKIEAGKIELENISFDLRKIVESVKTSLIKKADAKYIDFKTSIDHNTPQYLMGDSLRLRQILLNLAFNSIKFTEKGYVKIAVKTLEKNEFSARLRFEVSDTGIGIAPEQVDKIFTAFTQAEKSTSRKYGGTGLGISICDQLVTLMKGKLQVESELNKGSTFWFDLKLAISKEEAIAIKEAVAKIQESFSTNKEVSFSDKHILLVEDYIPNQQIALNHLKKLNCNIDIANNGKEAIEASNNKFYNLILMDVQMPYVDGYEATKKIRKESKLCANTKILAMTANSGKEELNKCLASGMNGMITKPLRFQTFIKEIMDTLQQVDNVAPPVRIAEKAEEEIAPKKIDLSLIELDKLLEEYKGNKERVISQLKLLTREFDDQRYMINHAIEIDDIEIIGNEFKKINTACVDFCLPKLANISEEICRLSKKGDIEKSRELIKEFNKELSAVKKLIN